MQTVTLNDPATGNSARILTGLGFNCFEWIVQFDDGPRDLLWAEPQFAQGEGRPSGSGIPLLFPFPGRICNGEFEYNGKNYAIPHDDGRQHALHGFIFNRPWRVIEQSDTQVTAAFQASVDDPSILDAWPCDFAVEASYELAGGELRFDATFSNPGDVDLPWGFGTHTYFRVPLADDSQLAGTVLTAPLDAEWQLEEMLPTGKLLDLPSELTLTDGFTLADHQFDNAYRLSTTTGEVTTVVADPPSGRRVAQTYNAGQYPHLVVYTPGHREAVCMEPYTCVPDPFRLGAAGIDTGLQLMPPGQRVSTRVVLRAE